MHLDFAFCTRWFGLKIWKCCSNGSGADTFAVILTISDVFKSVNCLLMTLLIESENRNERLSKMKTTPLWVRRLSG